MRLILGLIVVMFSSSIMNAQVATNTESKDSTNIYYQAFQKFCNQKSETIDVLLVEENNLT